MNKNNYCVIMAGGVGSRFWPLSKMARPKQFIDILGVGETLIQQTFRRFARVCPSENIYIVTNEMYRDVIHEQIPNISDEQIIGEPARRNTAPCIAYANYKILARNPQANIVVAPSDHIVLKEDVFVEVIKTALKASNESNELITLGIQPNRPETGYGYIQFDENVTSEICDQIYKVKTFTEKPNLEMAKQLVESGEFLWNSGIFIWKLETIMREFEKSLPEMDELFKSGVGLYNTPEETAFIKNTYEQCKSISVDYGIMEKATNVSVYSAEFGWSDLGTWGSLYDIREKDVNGNSIVGRNVMTYDSKNCIINMPKEKLVVIEGLEDYIVVENDNVLLICKKQDEQEIRQFVADVQAEKGDRFV